MFNVYSIFYFRGGAWWLYLVTNSWEERVDAVKSLREEGYTHIRVDTKKVSDL